MVMNELVKNIEQWAQEKGLHESNPESQFLKVAEELGEIGAAMSRMKKKPEKIIDLKDAIGDTTVTLIILAMQHGLDFQDCLQAAYDVIKNRTGEMVNGTFIKSEDLEG